MTLFNWIALTLTSDTFIKTALKSPTPLELLLENLDMEVAVCVLPKAIGTALIDQQINSDEDSALKAIYGALESKSRG